MANTAKRKSICELDKATALKLLEGYRSRSAADEKLEKNLYMEFCYTSFSAEELADRNHISRFTVYRKINKVDAYLRSIVNNK